MANGQRAERSLGELFQELSQDTSALIRQEMALARTEMSDRISAFGRDAAMMGAGGVLIHVALLAATAAFIMGLVQLGVQGWLSALIVAVVYAIGGGVVIMSARAAMKRRSLAPVETVDSLKETAQWLKNQTR
jgi:Putative Actinobacterial Holin-X, holin superfamily III